MALIKDAVWGKVRGKLGNLVVYEANGQVRMRRTPLQYRDAKSPKQLAHRARVRGVADLYAGLDNQLAVYWEELTEGTTMNGYNLFMSSNLKWLDKRGRVGDHGRLVVCRGDVAAPRWVKMRVKGEEEWRTVREEGETVAGLEREEMLARLAGEREAVKGRVRAGAKKVTRRGEDGKWVTTVDGEVVDLDEEREDEVVVRSVDVGEGRTVEVEWDKRTCNDGEDYFQVVMFVREEEWEPELWVDEWMGVHRRVGRAEWRFPERVDGEEVKGRVYLYGFFKGRFTNEVSESFYLGAFEV